MRQNYIPELDSVRGAAILAVTLYHLRLSLADSSPLRQILNTGWIGVDLFFVLSGFLITRILLGQKGQPGYYLNFYVRRGLRIWPLYFSLLGVLITACWLSGQPLPVSPWQYFGYVQNLTLGTYAWAPLIPTWSLAVEEQFYLLWPLVIAIASRRALRFLLPTLLLLSPLIRRSVFALSQDWSYVYTNTFCRLDGLVLGAGLALLVEHLNSIRLRRLACASLLIGGSLTLVMLRWSDAEGQRSVWLYSALALANFGLVGLILTYAGSRRLAFLRRGPLNYLGRISYGLYLLQFTVFIFVGALRLPEPLDFLVKLGASVSVASLSWHYFERPLLAKKDALCHGLKRLLVKPETAYPVISESSAGK